MQLSLVLSTLALGLAASAAPVTNAAPAWTITSMTRTCNSANTSCKVVFGVNPNDGSAKGVCSYTVTTPAGTPADRANSGSQQCTNGFSTQSGWSGQFPVGFTTWGLTRPHQIAFPSYSDTDLKNGVAVTPDRSFQVSAN